VKITVWRQFYPAANDKEKEKNTMQTISRAAFSLALLGIATGVALAQPFAYVADGGSGAVFGYTVDPATGVLMEVNGPPFSAGSSPQAVVATPSGKFVYAANYDGTIYAFRLTGTNGALASTGSPYQAGAYPSGLAISPSGKFLYTGNINSNNISGFSIDSGTGALTQLSGSPFAGAIYPEWLAFTSSGKYLYASNTAYGTISGFAVGSDGSLTPVSGSPYTIGGYPFGLAVSPSGKFLYVPNESSISVFSIDSATGALTPISGSPFSTGGELRSVAITPSGQFLYSVGSENDYVSGFRIDRATGTLTAVAGSPFTAGLYPSYITISSSGQFAYVADENGGQVSGYSIDPSTGALMPLSSSPFPAGIYPEFIAFANPATKACGALNVSAEATLAPGPYTRQSRGSDLWNETLTITNGVTPISGPLSVVLEDLPSSTTTLSGTYPGLTTTYCFSAAGNYVVPIDSLIPPANDDTLLAGEALPVPFVFATTGGTSVKPTHYKATLISGTLDK